MSHATGLDCLKFTLVLSLLLLCLPGKSQYNFSELDKALTVNQKALGNNVAALVYKDGKIVYQKEMGELTVKSQGPVASCGKWLIAALVMTFVDEGKLSLDDKVSTYIPIFETYSKSYITVRQCLAHETGIADTKGVLGKLLEHKKFESLEEEVNSFAKKEITGNAGTIFFYGNIGPDIAARVVEIVGKKSFETLMKQRIFNPLLMRHSTFTGDADLVDPAGGALSTAADYMNFLVMILGKGTFMGTRVLSEKAIAEMQTIQNKNIPIKYTPKMAEGFDYGLGEWIQETDAKGNSTVVSSPALYGTWPYVDKCRGYACIFFVKSLLPEDKKDLFIQLKKIIDQQLPSACN